MMMRSLTLACLLASANAFTVAPTFTTTSNTALSGWRMDEPAPEVCDNPIVGRLLAIMLDLLPPRVH